MFRVLRRTKNDKKNKIKKITHARTYSQEPQDLQCASPHDPKYHGEGTEETPSPVQGGPDARLPPPLRQRRGCDDRETRLRIEIPGSNNKKKKIKCI